MTITRVLVQQFVELKETQSKINEQQQLLEDDSVDNDKDAKEQLDNLRTQYENDKKALQAVPAESLQAMALLYDILEPEKTVTQVKGRSGLDELETTPSTTADSENKTTDSKEDDDEKDDDVEVFRPLPFTPPGLVKAPGLTSELGLEIDPVPVLKNDEFKLPGIGSLF